MENILKLIINIYHFIIKVFDWIIERTFEPLNHYLRSKILEHPDVTIIIIFVMIVFIFIFINESGKYQYLAQQYYDELEDARKKIEELEFELDELKEEYNLYD